MEILSFIQELDADYFVCFANAVKGKTLSKQCLSHLVVEAISCTYAQIGAQMPSGVHAHSTRGVHLLLGRLYSLS